MSDDPKDKSQPAGQEDADRTRIAPMRKPVPPAGTHAPDEAAASDKAGNTGGQAASASDPVQTQSDGPQREAEPDEDDLARPGNSQPSSPDAPGPETTDGATRLVPGKADVTESEARTEFAPGNTPPPLSPPGSLATRLGATVTVGTLINNNYEVQEILKSGGMGEVFKGREIGTGDPVAIKAILAELAEDEKAGQMFQREARTLRQLSDDAIVRYYNYVHDRDLDRYFLVMEFIEGVPLSEHVDRTGPISPAAARTLMKRLAKGLQQAHDKQVIHRDLSPDNVMLPGGVVSEARLIDFGIAKSSVVKEATVHGQFAGKFKYVAPEQLGHFDGEIGPYTDIYGLALLISAAVIGQPLDMGGSIFEAVQSRQTIPDLSAVPVELRPILSYMLEPDPADRPSSMDHVREMLENPRLIPQTYLSGLPMPPAMETTGQRPLTTATPIGTTPAGLQVPMGGVSHYPQTTQTGFPQSQPPEPVAPDRSGGRVLGLLALIFVGALAGAGWYAWSQGLIGPGLTAASEEMQEAAQEGQGLPDPDPNTRDGFLAGFDTGPCTYTVRVSAGPNAGVVEGFSSSGEAFAGLPVAYEEKFGARPAILMREIEPAQCAALDFARALQGRGGPPVQTQFSAETVTSGEALSAQIGVSDDAALWTVLISPLGAVYNLTGRVSDPVGDRRSLRFGLTLTEGSAAVPQLILTVASTAPLARAAAARDGALANELLPQVLEEIAGRGGGASAALGYVLLTPPETPPENGTDN